MNVILYSLLLVLPTTDEITKAGKATETWWSFTPIEQPIPPTSAGETWCNNSVDDFILAKLNEKGLQPSGQAERTVLLRRLAFDLLGLPPTSSQLTRWFGQDQPTNISEIIEEMLDSPHYGERWARHWLDVARFGESQGFERDLLRTDSWRYRDWVVQAFADDMPYNEFIKLQIAGDVIQPDDPRSITATGFLVAGPYDQVGQTQQSKKMRQVVRQEDLADIVGTTTQTFLGLTAQCARCHDHKYDPISQKEYFELVAALSGVRHGSRILPSDTNRNNVSRQELAQATATFSSQLEVIDQLAESRLQQEDSAQEVTLPVPIASWNFENSTEELIRQIPGKLSGDAKLTEAGLLLSGPTSALVVGPILERMSAITLEAWIQVKHPTRSQGLLMSVSTIDDKHSKGIQFVGKESDAWSASLQDSKVHQSFGGAAQTSGQFEHIVLMFLADYRVALFRNGKLYGKPFEAPQNHVFRNNTAQVIFGATGKKNKGSFIIRSANLYDRTITPQQINQLAGGSDVTIEKILEVLTPKEKMQRDQLLIALSDLNSRQQLLEPGSAHAGTPGADDPTFVLERGDPSLKGEEVFASSIDAVLGPNAFDIQKAVPESQRRLALAQWLSDAKNPLTARVMANRIWHYHFGSGLVSTPNDFGANGDLPTHPELLDWLAAEFIESGWSVKHIHRLILNSATYQQASIMNRPAFDIDPENRLLWRKSPTRLDAEQLRDAILSVAGELNPTVGGPSYQDFKSKINNNQLYEPIDPIGYAYQRRSLYRTWVRSGRNPLLDLFDCPDPSITSPTRRETNTPLQALALLNNSFVLRMAAKFSERLKEEAGANTTDQISLAYWLSFCRQPSPEEIAEANEFINEQGITAYCRVLVNSNAFLYMD